MTEYWQSQRPNISDEAYLAEFTVQVDLALGPIWHDDFKQMAIWCDQYLGQRYKDWFLKSLGKGRYRLYAKPKPATTLLLLKTVDYRC